MFASPLTGAEYIANGRFMTNITDLRHAERAVWARLPQVRPTWFRAFINRNATLENARFLGVRNFRAAGTAIRILFGFSFVRQRQLLLKHQNTITQNDSRLLRPNSRATERRPDRRPPPPS